MMQKYSKTPALQPSIHEACRPLLESFLSQAEALISQRKQSISLLDELLKSTFLEMFGDPVRNEKGCLSSRFYLDSADNNSAMLVEEWETEEDWDNHLHSRYVLFRNTRLNYLWLFKLTTE